MHVKFLLCMFVSYKTLNIEIHTNCFAIDVVVSVCVSFALLYNSLSYVV